MMTTMAREFISLFFVIVYIGCAVSAIGDPTAKLTFKHVQVDNVLNPYFDAWNGEIEESGAWISFKVPVKADLPGDLKMKGTAEFNGMKLGTIDMPLCDAFKDELIGRSIVEAGTPKDKFPSMCPIKANAEYVISKYTYPPAKIPPGIPNGKILADIELYKTGESPYVKIHIEADFSHQFPGLGR